MTRILVALGAFSVIFVADKTLGLASVIGGRYGWLLPFGLYLSVYLLIGYDVLRTAAKNLARGQALDEHFLMSVATLGAFALAISRGATGKETEGFDEACAVLLFYQVGEFFQRYATGKSRKSISALMDIRPDSANVIREGKILTVSPDEVHVDECILVNPGEKIPLDGVIVKGSSSIDAKALTGESAPQDVREGETALSGCINLTTQLEIKVTKLFYDSTVSKILDLVENASDKKSRAENFITKFAKYYTPVVVGLALVLGLGGGIVTGLWGTWIYRAFSFLVVSCPCALVISIPMSFFAGIGTASRYRILVKGSNYLEKFARANVFVFDKTGTLTKGNFAVTGVYPEIRRAEILRLAATAEQGSAHPIAKAIIAAQTDGVDEGYVLTNEAGKGIVAVQGKQVIVCGNRQSMLAHNVRNVAFADLDADTVVYVAKNGEYVGRIHIADEVKAETRSVMAKLHQEGCRTVMLTGDGEAVAAQVASEVGVTTYKASLFPQHKVEEVEKLLEEKGRNDVLCFVGDGINDAPVLMRSDVGVAMGALGSDAAIEAADIVLMQDDLRGLLLAKRIARKTMRIVKQNVIFSLSVKVGILLLAALGFANMWLAVFGDVGVALLAILNAMRVGRGYRNEEK